LAKRVQHIGAGSDENHRIGFKGVRPNLFLPGWLASLIIFVRLSLKTSSCRYEFVAEGEERQVG
jgi:hypothetical protein